jgi:Flp pilus assembly protein TadD
MALPRLIARGLGACVGLGETLVGDTAYLVRLRAQLMIQGGTPERAILYLHEHLLAHPESPWLHYHAGRAAQAKGLEDEARARFAHAATLAPNEATFRFALGYTLRHGGLLEMAAREYRQALRVAPNEARILFNLGIVERERGELGAAQRCFEQVCTRWTRDARAHYTLGVCAFERRAFERARSALNRALRLDRNHHKALYQLALVDLEEDDFPAARVRLRKALVLQPTYAPGHYALGRSLVASDPPVARKHLEEAVLGHPPVLRAHLDLARLHESAGRLKRARADYQLYQRHFPNKREALIATRLSRIEQQLADRHRA